MPDSPLAPGLEQLPQAAQALAQATLVVGREIVADSAAAADFRSGAPQSLLAIRRVALHQRIYLACEGEELIFFFIKRQLSLVRPIEAHLRFAMQAVEDDGYLPPADDACSYWLICPTFLSRMPATEDLRRAVTLLPFIETLRLWLTDQGTESGHGPDVQKISLALPRSPTDWNHVHTTLHRFLEGFLGIELEMCRVRMKGVLPPLDRITPFYRPVDYQAEIALQLDRKGRFAQPGLEAPISFSLQLRVERDAQAKGQAGMLVAHITLRPPDFLVAGTLHDAFVQALQDDEPSTRKLRDELRLPQEEFTTFLTSAKAHAVIFRTEHGPKADTDTIVLPGSYQGTPRTLILIVEVTVKADATSPEVALRKVTLGYDSLYDEDQALDDKTLAYFTRLCSSFSDWRSVL